MNHVIWHICNPNLCFPSECSRKLLKRLKVKKRGHINFTSRNAICYFLNLLDSFGSMGPTEVTASIKYSHFFSAE